MTCDQVPNVSAIARRELRIAIVDDSPMIRARLAEALAEIPNVRIIGHADTEADATALLLAGGWDVVILDLQLKQGTGLAVLRALVPRPTHPKTTVIVFTTYTFPQLQSRSILLGADYFFRKAREFYRVHEVIADLAKAESPTNH